MLGPVWVVWGKEERHCLGQGGCGDKRVKSRLGHGQWGDAEVGL